MPRAPEHPSGAKVNVTIKLSPDHLERLDEHAGRLGLSRSSLIAKLLDRAYPAGAESP